MNEQRRAAIIALACTAVKAIRGQRNDKLPLFRLPLELRIWIYKLVCGGHTIHLDLGRKHISHHLCCAVLSEGEAQERFDTSKAVWYAPETAHRHQNCNSHTRCSPNCVECLAYSKSGNCQTKKLETNILYCCRQMYLESEFVPYYANTFSFGLISSLDRFLGKIPERYRTVIRSIHVDFMIFPGNQCSRWDWEHSLETVALFLKTLQRLYITIELRPAW